MNTKGDMNLRKEIAVWIDMTLVFISLLLYF